MRSLQALLSLMLLISVGAISSAADSDDLARENAELRQKVEKLDKDLEEIKKIVIPETAAQAPKPVMSSLDIQLYGYLKFDAAYDTSRIENGNYAQWVESESPNDDDDQFNMTANQSRFGMKINGPNGETMNTSGRVEVDFYGGGPAENKAHLMMRHAYMKLDWPEDRFNIIAGQTSDVISPLLPSTVNYSVCWWTGNIGYRRPQMRLTKELGFEAGGFLKLEGALARTIGQNSITGTDSGEDAGIPTFQGRASMTLPMLGAQEATIGLSGHLGKEEYDIAVNGRDKEFTTWSLNLDYTQPICSKVQIKAELFTGENLNAYLGGIGQGVTISGLNQYEEIGSKGGWIAAGLGPWDKKQFNVGVAMDDVNRGNVNPGGRTLNRSVFANVICSMNEQTDFGFEISHWRTEYRGPGDADSLRLQTALIYKF
ncbi:MAG: DcaP family trimeric outer membrane transporter [Sedimentisphaerales bacterium]